MDLIIKLFSVLFNMYNEFENFKNMDYNFFNMDYIYKFLVNQYNIDINLSDLTYINNNIDLFDLLDYKKMDLNSKQINLLNLYDLNFLMDKSITIKIKTLKNLRGIKKENINYIVINYKGGDKTYNIILFKNRIEYNNLIYYFNKSDKIKKDKTRTFYRKHKYNYNKCKLKTFRKKERELISNKKYSHNFKKNNNHYKKYNDMDLTYDMLNTLINDYYTNKDLLNAYVNDYNINNHLINVPIIMERLITNMELIFNEYKKTNKDKYYLSFKFMLNNYNQIKSFNNDLKDYKDYLIKNNDLYNKKTYVSDY